MHDKRKSELIRENVFLKLECKKMERSCRRANENVIIKGDPTRSAESLLANAGIVMVSFLAALGILIIMAIWQ